MVGVPRRALPSVVPTARPVNAPNRLVSVYERATGTPIVADGDHVRVRRDGGAEDRRRQRERRAGGVRGAPRLDRDLPDARHAGWWSCG